MATLLQHQTTNCRLHDESLQFTTDLGAFTRHCSDSPRPSTFGICSANTTQPTDDHVQTHTTQRNTFQHYQLQWTHLPSNPSGVPRLRCHTIQRSVLVLSSALATRGALEPTAQRRVPTGPQPVLLCQVEPSRSRDSVDRTSPFSGLWKIQMVALLENFIEYNTAELQTKSQNT